MLSLIPALILIAFHGPSGFERLAHEGRLPDALRALERVLAPEEAESGDENGHSGPQCGRKSLGSWSALFWGPEFTQALSHFLQISFAEPPSKPTLIVPDPPFANEIPSLDSSSKLRLQAGFGKANSTRAGPRA